MGSGNKSSPSAKPRSASKKTVNVTLYHGSPNDNITSFDLSKASQNVSSGEHFIFFTDSKTFADEFSYERIQTSSSFINQKGKKGAVYQANVTMKNPLDFNNLSSKDIKNIVSMDIDGILTEDDVKRYISLGNHQLLKSSFNINDISKYGYDGFIAKLGKRYGNALEYAVVNPNQIKNIKKQS